MIHLVIGPSCAGKTSFVVNQFIHGQRMTEFRDMITVTECEDCFLIGKYIVEGSRTKGTDRVSRKDIPKIGEQVLKLIPKGKDIILEGDKICSENLFEKLSQTDAQCQLWWVRCSDEKSLERNRRNNSTCTDRYLKVVAKKARNLFWKFYIPFRGGIIDTENVEDFTKVDTSHIKPEYPYLKIKPVREDFAVYVVTNGRAERQESVKRFRRAGYTGRIFYVVDDEDSQLRRYKEIYGDNVRVFSKQEYIDRIDWMTNRETRKAAVYGKCACFDIAKADGIQYFCMIDDDITRILFKDYRRGKLNTYPATSMNEICNRICETLEKAPFECIGIAKDGAYIGGANEAVKDGIFWRLSQCVFYRTDRPWKFRSIMYEDTMSSLDMPLIGRMSNSITSLSHDVEHNKSLPGGMNETYTDAGDSKEYIGNFMLLMAHPDALVLTMAKKRGKMQWRFRLNHDSCFPKVLNERWRK